MKKFTPLLAITFLLTFALSACATPPPVCGQGATTSSSANYTPRITKKANSNGDAFTHAVSLTCYKGEWTALLTGYRNNSQPSCIPDYALNVLNEAMADTRVRKPCTAPWEVAVTPDGSRHIFVGWDAGNNYKK